MNLSKWPLKIGHNAGMRRLSDRRFQPAAAAARATANPTHSTHCHQISRCVITPVNNGGGAMLHLHIICISSLMAQRRERETMEKRITVREREVIRPGQEWASSWPSPYFMSSAAALPRRIRKLLSSYLSAGEEQLCGRRPVDEVWISVCVCVFALRMCESRAARLRKTKRLPMDMGVQPWTVVLLKIDTRSTLGIYSQSGYLFEDSARVATTFMTIPANNYHRNT